MVGFYNDNNKESGLIIWFTDNFIELVIDGKTVELDKQQATNLALDMLNHVRGM